MLRSNTESSGDNYSNSDSDFVPIIKDERGVRKIETGPEYFPEITAEQYPRDNAWNFIQTFVLGANPKNRINLDAALNALFSAGLADFLTPLYTERKPHDQLNPQELVEIKLRLIVRFRDIILPLYFKDKENSLDYQNAATVLNGVIRYAESKNNNR